MHIEKKISVGYKVTIPKWTQDEIIQFVSEEFDKSIGKAILLNPAGIVGGKYCTQT